MTRKQIALMAAIVVTFSSLSALVAYHHALRRVARSYATSSTSSGAGKKNCVDFHEAPSHLNEDTCVSGRVVRVSASSSGNVFVDFCTDYHTCPFTSVIFSSDREKFGNLQTLSGRKVELDGRITEYRGRAEIVLKDPKQIRVPQP